MGKYINTTSTNEPLPPLGKAKKLIEDGASQVPTPSEWSEGLVCVANNGPFECAAYIFNEAELEAFKYPCGRMKTWLKYPHAKTVAQ